MNDVTPPIPTAITGATAAHVPPVAARSYVIMAVYRGDRVAYLEPAIRSVLVRDIDRVLIGIDGAVGADLAAVLRRVSASDGRVAVIPFAHSRGLAPVLNDLIDRALADPACAFLFRMDADDLSDPGRFSAQRRYLTDHPKIDVLGGCAELVDEQDVAYGSLHKASDDAVLKRRLPYDSPFVHPTVAFRASLLRQGHRYPTDTIRFEDVAFWAELALAGTRFANLPDSILRYRSTTATAHRRTGLRKVFNETLVRLRYVLRATPWRLDVMSLVTLIALAKWFMPVAALAWLQTLRARVHAPASSLR